MALVTSEAGLPVACDTVDAIVAQVPAGFACRSLIPTVDRIDNWRQGAFALWLDPGGIIIESANASRGDRPVGAASGLGQGTRPPRPAGGQARRQPGGAAGAGAA